MLSRRALLAGTAALAFSACSRAAEQPAGMVAFPERSLNYAPLLLAVKDGLSGRPPTRLGMLQRDRPRDVAADLTQGKAIAGALSIPDFLQSVAAGMPLVAIGALTRRASGFLVVASGGLVADRRLSDLVEGAWNGLRFGVRSGGDGTEYLLRFLFLAAGRTPPALITEAEAGPVGPIPANAAELPAKWVRYATDEALVAALNDHRILGFLGSASAAAEAVLLGSSTVEGRIGEGQSGDVAAALPTVLATSNQQLASAGKGALLRSVMHACAQAGIALSAPDAPAAAMRALPERDALRITTALRLEAQSHAGGLYTVDGRLPTLALQRALEWMRQTGTDIRVDPAVLVADLST